MINSTMTLRNVKAVRITKSAQINDKQTREIEIDLDDGTTMAIELWSTYDKLTLEIL